MNVDLSGSGKRPRARSIRRRIALLLVVPLLSLIGLWAFAASLTLGATLSKDRAATTYDKVGVPSAYLAIQLQIERQLTSIVVATHGQDGVAALQAQRAKTDQAQQAFEKSALTPAVRDAASKQIQQRLDDFVLRMQTLPPQRAKIDAGAVDLMGSLTVYNDLVGSSFYLFQSLTIINDLSIYRQGNGLITMSWAREFMLREDSLINAIQSGDGKLTPDERTAVVGWIYSGRQATMIALADLSGEVRVPFANLVNSPDFRHLRDVEDELLARPNITRLPPSVVGWSASATPVLTSWGQATGQAGISLTNQARPVSDRIVLELIGAAGLGLIAVAASIFISIRFVRQISDELRDLQVAAVSLAEERLPRVVAKLRRGEEVDVAAAAPPIPGGRTAEIVRVADSFSTVQRTAIDTAVGEAYLRKGISRVFLNLAWRSQSLLHRQLRMLDAMERKATDPEELEDLFRLDHLTTRMRRHAEGLVILSGAPAGRGWNQPVSMDDVLRGAVAEVEEYTRVDVVLNDSASLTGSAVADIIHLLAELIENATAFSPPPTEVLVRGEVVGTGFAVEVIDRGIGLAADEMAQLNMRLAQPPEFDLADSDRLGLFVVARLAARHGVRVTLQPSAYGGTSAVVLIPHGLVILEDAATGVDGAERPQLNAATAITVIQQGGQAADARAWFEPSNGTRPAHPGPAEPPLSAPPPVYGHRTPTGEFGPTVEVEPTGGWEAIDGEELPRRVRQASLVPQLRKEPDRQAPQPSDPVDDDDDNRPEESRNLMTSLQSGWLLGRGSDEGDDGIPFERRNEWGES